jgi:hypothetical protein
VINKNLPEPEIKLCATCGRKNGNLKGKLIHWPDDFCNKESIWVGGNLRQEPFSEWLYTCRWCRAASTRYYNKRRRNYMILNKEQMENFEMVTRPVIKWLNDNCHPHVVAIVDCGRAELAEGIYSFPTTDYIKD